MADRPDTDAIRDALGELKMNARHLGIGDLAERASAELDQLTARLSEYEQALRVIEAAPSEYDLLHNAVAKAMAYIARAVLSGSAGE